MKTIVFVVVSAFASTAFAQDFYSAPSIPGATTGLITVPAGVERCWTVTVATSKDYTFSLSASDPGCTPFDGQLVLYPPRALDPTVWMANVEIHEQGECVALERRLTAGTYKICAAALARAPATFALHRKVGPNTSTPANDTCKTPTRLSSPSGTLKSLDLIGAEHDYSPVPVGVCSAASPAKGPDRVWSITVPTGRTLRVHLATKGGNPTLYFLDDCERWWVACVAASALPGGRDEDASWQNTTGADKTIFVVVDTPRQTSPSFDLTWEVR